MIAAGMEILMGMGMGRIR